MMTLLLPYHPDLDLTLADVWLLSVQPFSSYQAHALEEKDLDDLIEKIHQLGKKVYVSLNRFIFEPELKACKDLLDRSMNKVDGFILGDVGLMAYLRGQGFEKEIIYQTNTTMTNSRDIDVLLHHGFSRVMAARELTLDELLVMADHHGSQLVVCLFGHQIISSSRRKLLSAYQEASGAKLMSHRVYQMVEANRTQTFLVEEDESGTHVFDGKIYSLHQNLDQFLDKGVCYYLLDSFHLSAQDIEIAVECFREKRDLDPYFLGRLGRGLLDQKTSEKKEGD